VTQAVEGCLYIVEADLEREGMKDVPDQLGRKSRGIPYLMSRGRRKDNKVAHTLVVCIKREVGLEKLLCVKIQPV
jgi:hypothetical protein